MGMDGPRSSVKTCRKMASLKPFGLRARRHNAKQRWNLHVLRHNSERATGAISLRLGDGCLHPQWTRTTGVTVVDVVAVTVALLPGHPTKAVKVVAETVGRTIVLDRAVAVTHLPVATAEALAIVIDTMMTERDPNSGRPLDRMARGHLVWVRTSTGKMRRVITRPTAGSTLHHRPHNRIALNSHLRHLHSVEHRSSLMPPCLISSLGNFLCNHSLHHPHSSQELSLVAYRHLRLPTIVARFRLRHPT